MFAGKYGLITLRDLFRWAERYRRSPTISCQFKDWEQQLAEDGEYCVCFIILVVNVFIFDVLNLSATNHYFLLCNHKIFTGFMLLAGRLRENSDEKLVLDVIQKHFKRKIEPCKLFGQDGGQGSLASHDCLQLLRSPLPEEFNHLVWTAELLRMAVLAYRAISFDEPILLVGNTGLD